MDPKIGYCMIIQEKSFYYKAHIFKLKLSATFLLFPIKNLKFQKFANPNKCWSSSVQLKSTTVHRTNIINF